MKTQQQNYFLKMRERWLIGLVEWTKPYYAKWFKKEAMIWKQNTESLLRFPPASLGHELGAFLQREDLVLLPNMENHDVMHVLLDYPTTISGEIRMQFFLLGNRKRSLYALFTVLLGSIVAPEYWKTYLEAFRKGRQSLSIAKWRFEYLLCEPLSLLRQQIFKHPIQHQTIIF